MKKFLVALIVLLVLAGTASYFLWYKPQQAIQATPLQILPPDTLAVFEARDLKATIDGFRSGPLGQALTGIDIREAGLKLDAEPEEIEELIAFQKELAQTVDGPWFDELFGQQVVLGLLPLDIDTGEEPAPETFLRAPVLVTQPRQPAKLMDSLSKLLIKDIEITTETIEGHTVNKAVAPDAPPFYYAVNQGLVVAGLDPDPILRCLNQDPAKSPGLASAAAYQSMETALEAGQATRFKAFIDFESSVKWIEKNLPKLGADDQDMEDFKQILPYLAGLQTFGQTFAVDSGKMITGKARVLFDAQALHPAVAGVVDMTPGANPTLAMVPRDAIYYTWQNYQDLSDLWETLESSEDFSPEDAVQARGAFQGFTGVELEEALAAIGPQTAWVFNDLISGGFFPVPELALIMQSSKPAVLIRILESLAANLNVTLATEEVAGQTLTYAETPMGEDLSPAFICSGDYCTIATNRRLLKAMLTTGKEAGLNSNPKFQAVGKGFTDETNQIAFIDLERGVAKVKDVIKWGMSMAAMAAEKDGPDMTYALNHIVYPLLDALAQYPAMGSRTLIQKDNIIGDVYIQAPPAAQ